MYILFVLFIQIVLIHCLQGRASIRLDNVADSNQVNCGHNYQSNCLIEGTFGNTLSADTIDVLVNCTNLDDDNASQNQFSEIDSVVWNGCCALNNLKYFGLRKISRRKNVKMLKIVKFTATTVETGTFDGFMQLKKLSIEMNSIEYLLSSSFRGLKNLSMLQLIENNLKYIDSGTFDVFTALNALQIVDGSSLSMLNHQFYQNQIVDNVTMDIFSIEMDTIEHLLNHVRNLSVSLKFNEEDGELVECDEIAMIGYERRWMIEILKIDNLRCGFGIEDVESLKSLDITRAGRKFNEIKLKDLKCLENLSITFSELEELPTTLLIGNFNQLEAIDLSHNKLLTINMSTFNNLPKLKQLNIKYNDIHVLSEADNLNLSNIHIHVDYNSLDCEWLSSIVSQHIFTNFIYDKNFKFINVNGLQCSLHQQQSMTSSALSLPSTQHPSAAIVNEITKFHDENLNVKPSIFAFIICCAILLGIFMAYILIYTHNRIQLLKQQPFYHMLRDSLTRPIYTARETLANDFKGIVFRHLPPTNYEHPISNDDTDICEMDENVYEEIPQKMINE